MTISILDDDGRPDPDRVMVNRMLDRFARDNEGKGPGEDGPMGVRPMGVRPMGVRHPAEVMTDADLDRIERRARAIQAAEGELQEAFYKSRDKSLTVRTRQEAADRRWAGLRNLNGLRDRWDAMADVLRLVEEVRTLTREHRELWCDEARHSLAPTAGHADDDWQAQ